MPDRPRRGRERRGLAGGGRDPVRAPTAERRGRSAERGGRGAGPGVRGSALRRAGPRPGNARGGAARAGRHRAGPMTVIAIVGPTASGKSALAMRAAERSGGEIVSADSRQVYRGMDIGTAKPTVAERRRVPHHCIDLVEPTEPYDAARYQRDGQGP